MARPRTLLTRRIRRPEQMGMTSSPSLGIIESSQPQRSTRRVTRSMARGNKGSDRSNVSSTAEEPQPPAIKQFSEKRGKDLGKATASNIKWSSDSDLLDIWPDETAKEEPTIWDRPFEFRSQNDRWVHETYWGFAMTIDSCKVSWKKMLMDTSHFTQMAIATEKIPFSDLSPSTQDQLTSFCPRAQEYFTNTGSNGLFDLLEALVWRTIWKHQLSPQCQSKWHGPEWKAYAHLRATFKASLTDTQSSLDKTFHTWRYHTTRLLYVNHGRHSKAERLENLLREELKDFIYKNGQPREIVDESLAKFAENVVRFDFWMETTKFLVQLVFDDEATGKLYGFPLPETGNSSTKSHMVNRKAYITRDGNEVDLIVSPVFRAYGKKVRRGDLVADAIHGNETDVMEYDVCRYMYPGQVSSAGSHVAKGAEP